jgi:sulfotransferase
MFLSKITHSWTGSVDVKNELNRDREGTEDKMVRTMRAYVEAWHNSDKLVFDKARGWSNNILTLHKLYPNAKAIIMIRDLRNVFSSIEKQHRKFPLLDEAQDLNGKTIYTRADAMFGPEGIIGGPIIGIEDIIRRNHDNILFVKCEDLTEDPEKTMREMYRFLEERLYEHDFEDVEDTSTDPDGFYLWKYPHEGKGKVEPTDPDEWVEYVSEDLAGTIMGRFENFNKQFGYK